MAAGVRRRCTLCIGLFALLIAAAAPVKGQVARYDAGFERDVNRYRWTGGFELDQPIGNWRIRALDSFRSDAYILFDDRLSFRDENLLSMEAVRPVSRALSVAIIGRSGWFSLSRVLSQEVYGGLNWRPAQGVEIQPLLGATFDQRPGARVVGGSSPLRTDIGPAAGFRVRAPGLDLSGYRVSLDSEGYWLRIDPRRGRSVRALATAERRFEATRLSSEIQVSSVRRDAYQAASFLNREGALRQSETVESTRNDTIRAQISVETPIARSIDVTGRLGFSANNRLVRTLRAPTDALFFDSDFSRRTVDADLGLRYGSGLTEVRLAMQGGAEIERRRLANTDDLPGPQASQKSTLLQQADYDRGFLSFVANARAPLGARFVWTMDGSANAIRHDTPIVNPDDRDEVFYNGRTGLMARLTRELDFDVQLSGSYYHTVYLKASRSADNNVQRSLRLQPSITWRPGRETRIRLQSEVRATYTVDDFVLPGRRPTDQSARELRYDAAVEHGFDAGLRLLATGALSDLRLGRFLAGSFSEIPFDTLKTYSAWVRLQSTGRVTAEVGIRVFIRTDYNRASTVRYGRVDAEGIPVLDDDGHAILTSISRPGREIIAQSGPTVALVWPMHDGAFLRFDGWLTLQRVSNRLYGDLPSGADSVIRRAARRGATKTIPNLAVTMSWAF